MNRRKLLQALAGLIGTSAVPAKAEKLAPLLAQEWDFVRGNICPTCFAAFRRLSPEFSPGGFHLIQCMGCGAERAIQDNERDCFATDPIAQVLRLGC